MDHNNVQRLIKQIYSIVSDLESMFVSRHFIPDGHLVGWNLN